MVARKSRCVGEQRSRADGSDNPLHVCLLVALASGEKSNDGDANQGAHGESPNSLLKNALGGHAKTHAAGHSFRVALARGCEHGAAERAIHRGFVVFQQAAKAHDYFPARTALRRASGKRSMA